MTSAGSDLSSSHALNQNFHASQSESLDKLRADQSNPVNAAFVGLPKNNDEANFFTSLTR
jgi:hypothetical protein